MGTHTQFRSNILEIPTDIDAYDMSRLIRVTHMELSGKHSGGMYVPITRIPEIIQEFLGNFGELHNEDLL